MVPSYHWSGTSTVSQHSLASMMAFVIVPFLAHVSKAMAILMAGEGRRGDFFNSGMFLWWWHDSQSELDICVTEAH
jgi:hypothetical protein